MSEVDSQRPRQLGLSLAALVLVADSVPLGLWGLRMWAWIQDIQRHPSRDFIASTAETIGCCFLGGALILLIAATLAVMTSAVKVASGREQGLLTGVVAGFTTAGVCAYLAYVGVSLDPRPWIGYSLANAVTALYLAFYRWRQLREATREAA